MKIKILISILVCIGLMLCFIACSDEDTGADGNNPTESSAPSQNGGGESKPSEDDKTGYHTVTFITNSDSVIEPVMVERGNPIPVQAKPEKAGYVFDGWYLGEEKWSFISHVVLVDLTLEAKWIANENTVMFNANGGVGTMAGFKMVTDSVACLPNNTYTKAGYTFVGWSTTEGGEVAYTDGAEYTMGTEPSYTLYAVWEISVNGLSFDANGGDGNMTSLAVNSFENVTLPKNTFTRKGYTFKGWATTADGGVEYTDGAEYTMGTEASYTFYAVWEANVYTITYEKNGGTGELKETFTIEDLPLTLSYLDDKTNYVFNCWYRESDFSGEPVLKITEIGNITLYAEYAECTDGLVLRENSSYYSVTGYTGTATKVVIPRSYKGKEVTSIGEEAFHDCTRLKSVTIPNSVTSIGDSAFGSCDSLTSVTIGNSVTSIGDSAFSFCTSLTSITIPDGVTSIGNHAFYYCTSLTSITIPDSVTSIGEWAFLDCTSLTSITIPEGVTSIGTWAFSECKSLTSITIPDSVTSIGNGAFRGCKSLASITIPDSVTSIGNYAFYGCSSFTSVTIPKGVTSIGSSAFAYCSSLTSITIPKGVTSIGDEAFRDCESLTSITIPEGVTSIGGSAFWGCTSLTSVTIPEGVTSIGDHAFHDCTSLTSATIPEGVTSIGFRAFYNCTSLTSITIPEGVTSIGNYAFEDCTSLTSVTIGDGVTSIGEGAFNNCTSLTSITIGDGVTSIGENAFDYCESLTIYCEAESQPDGWDSSWNYSKCPVVWNCNNNEVADDGCIYTVIDGIRYALKDGEASVATQPSNITTAYILASVSYKGQEYSVTSIGEEAFDSCKSLTSVTIPEGVTSIGDNAFDSCKSLTSITIPKGVTSIGHHAFDGCTSLTSITIPDSVTRIGNRAFYNCTSLTIYCEATSKPSGWHSDWNGSRRPVVWGVK